MAMTKTEWNNLQKRLPPEDRESYEAYLATNPPASVSKKAPTSGLIPNIMQRWGLEFMQ